MADRHLHSRRPERAVDELRREGDGGARRSGQPDAVVFCVGRERGGRERDGRGGGGAAAMATVRTGRAVLLVVDIA
ncbi:hypothetical protein [Streptomyces fodineus]|uniref:hypothetical protein n=1 Tax=Streptomyces fodineus TaxID=1904616 RepID=UPI00131ECFF3|nr:hypothetical protein [Streptomyces fodineus]